MIVSSVLYGLRLWLYVMWALGLQEIVLEVSKLRIIDSLCTHYQNRKRYSSMLRSFLSRGPLRSCDLAVVVLTVMVSGVDTRGWVCDRNTHGDSDEVKVSRIRKYEGGMSEGVKRSRWSWVYAQNIHQCC